MILKKFMPALMALGAIGFAATAPAQTPAAPAEKAAPPPLEEFMRLPAYALPRVSRNGKYFAVTIPIKGKLTDPDIQLWPTVLGVIRNAFVQGLASGFANVPPPTAEKKEGPVVQAKNALTKDKGPPKAQPVTP